MLSAISAARSKALASDPPAGADPRAESMMVAAICCCLLTSFMSLSPSADLVDVELLPLITALPRKMQDIRSTTQRIAKTVMRMRLNRLSRLRPAS